MNNSGQVGPIGAIFLYIFFIINWFIWLGKWVGDVGTYVVTANSLTGIEAFFFNNLNFVIMIGITLGTLGFMYFTSGD